MPKPYWFVVCLAALQWPILAAGQPKHPKAKPTPATPEQQQQDPYAYWYPGAPAHPERIDPVECFQRAKETTFLNDVQATRLCHCAHTPARLICYLRGKQQTFLGDDALIQLCGGTDNVLLDLECAY